MAWIRIPWRFGDDGQCIDVQLSEPTIRAKQVCAPQNASRDQMNHPVKDPARHAHALRNAIRVPFKFPREFSILKWRKTGERHGENNVATPV